MIDAGHGGHDSGCLGTKTQEKDVALAVALKLGKYIKDNFNDVDVIYTRKTDVFVELHERANIANNAKADLFICIHCNSAGDEDVCGPETWVMGLHKSEANLAVSKRENDVVLLEKDYQKKYDGFDPNSPEANIIFSLYQNAYLDQSLKMASLVQHELKTKGRFGRGVKQAGFLVLYKTSMPSILVETGFLTNKNEEKFLSSTKGQDDIAQSIFSAFKTYKASLESSSTGSEEKEKKSEGKNDLGDDDSSSKAVVVKDKEEIQPVADDTESEKANHKSSPKTGNNGDKLIFSVQVVSSPKQERKDSGKFKGLKDIHEEKAGGLFKYSSGQFSELKDAIDYQSQMRNKGFKDAFVVAFKNGSRISIKEAREMIEKK